MRISNTTLMIWLIVAVLLLLVWATVTGRLGRSRHGYAAVIRVHTGDAAPAARS